MSFPENVKLTVITHRFTKAGKPASGVVVFRPDRTAVVGEGISLASLKFMKRLDGDGVLGIVVPSSYVPEANVDFTYDLRVLLVGGTYYSRTVKVPYSIAPVDMHSLPASLPGVRRNGPARDSDGRIAVSGSPGTLAPNSVGTEHLKDHSVTASKLTFDPVTRNSYLADLHMTAKALSDLQQQIDDIQRILKESGD
jgi:hypothetical protein